MSKKSLWPIFCIIFVDLLGLGIIIPVFAPLLLDAQHGILSLQATFGERTFLLGLLIAAYPLSQFFGAPMLGAMADHQGRRKILLLSLLGTLIGYIIFAIGVITRHIELMFAGRLIDGFTGGNLSVAVSAIADLSTEQNKAKHFGLAGVAVGLGFILGPVIGGLLSDPALVPWFNFATPFLFAAILSAINLGLVYWYFHETLHTKVETKIRPLTGFYNIAAAFKLIDLRTMFLVVFLLTFGFNFFIQFFQVFLIAKFHFTQSAIGVLFAYGGLWVAFSQGILMRFFAERSDPKRVLAFSALAMAVSLPILLLPDKPTTLYFILPFISIFQGLTQPTSMAIVSNIADPNSQGEILGINQSVQSLAQAVPPILAGSVISLGIDLPIIVAALATFVAWLIFFLVYRPHLGERFKEV